MSTPIKRRRRTRRACIPCHQRKRKCDAEYPCGMCTAYDYNCRYSEDGPSSRTQRNSPSDSTANNHRNLDTGNGRSRSIRHSTSLADKPTTATTATITTTATTPSTGIFDQHRSRYAGLSAAMAFPHILGVAFGSDSPPNKVQSFAYNFGIRPEESSKSHGSLSDIISEQDLAVFSNVYFTALAPVFDLLDPEIYRRRCRAYYRSHDARNASVAFGAVAAAVSALGSFLSQNRHPREPELVQHAKAILDDPATMRTLRIDHIIAMGLRVMYLRGTTRPNNAWIASCTVMHLCEAAGLHEEENIKKIASTASASQLGHTTERLRKIFWLAWAGHSMLCYEYDRSSVRFRAVTCEPIISRPGFVSDEFVRIVQLTPSSNSPFQLERQPHSPSEELYERLKALHNLEVTHPFLVVTKADVAFCFYRRLYHLKMGIAEGMIQLVIDAGNAAVQAALQLASQGRLFWNVIGSVFQYACVLLAIDTPAASSHISTVFEALEDLVRVADTAMAREALSVARHLLNLSIAKKRQHLMELETVETSCQSFFSTTEPYTNAPIDLGYDVDWDFLIEPYLSMLGPEFQL